MNKKKGLSKLMDKYRVKSTNNNGARAFLKLPRLINDRVN